MIKISDIDHISMDDMSKFVQCFRTVSFFFKANFHITAFPWGRGNHNNYMAVYLLVCVRVSVYLFECFFRLFTDRNIDVLYIFGFHSVLSCERCCFQLFLPILTLNEYFICSAVVEQQKTLNFCSFSARFLVKENKNVNLFGYGIFGVVQVEVKNIATDFKIRYDKCG